MSNPAEESNNIYNKSIITPTGKTKTACDQIKKQLTEALQKGSKFVKSVFNDSGDKTSLYLDQYEQEGVKNHFRHLNYGISLENKSKYIGKTTNQHTWIEFTVSIKETN